MPAHSASPSLQPACLARRPFKEGDHVYHMGSLGPDYNARSLSAKTGRFFPTLRTRTCHADRSMHMSAHAHECTCTYHADRHMHMHMHKHAHADIKATDRRTQLWLLLHSVTHVLYIQSTQPDNKYTLESATTITNTNTTWQLRHPPAVTALNAQWPITSHEPAPSGRQAASQQYQNSGVWVSLVVP